MPTESGCMIQVIPPSTNTSVCESVCANKDCSQTTEEVIWILSTEQTCPWHHPCSQTSALLLKTQLHSKEQLFVILVFFSLSVAPLMKGHLWVHRCCDCSLWKLLMLVCDTCYKRWKNVIIELLKGECQTGWVILQRYPVSKPRWSVSERGMYLEWSFTVICHV